MEVQDRDMGDLDNPNIKLAQQLTMIRSFIYDFDMDLQGYEWSGEAKKYNYTGACLVASDSRSKLLSNLKPFTSEINLITDLSDKEFSKMKYRTLSLINETLTTDCLGVPANHKRLVFNKYMNTLKLIGGIILGSKSDLIPIMQGMRAEEGESIRGLD